jgi:hypothetical protein
VTGQAGGEDHDPPRTVVEDALVKVQEVLSLIDSRALSARPRDLAALRAAADSLRLIADVLDRGGDGVAFP